MLRRMIYISRSLIGADPQEVEAIVSSSIRLNAEAQISGMLWADGRHFAQVIEGKPDEVGRTMERIRADHRHSDVCMLLDRQVRSRQFGNWSMRQAGNDDESAYATTFMIGFAMGERTGQANRLYEIVLSSDAGNVD
jgi:hypothetical protein